MSRWAMGWALILAALVAVVALVGMSSLVLLALAMSVLAHGVGYTQAHLDRDTQKWELTEDAKRKAKKAYKIGQRQGQGQFTVVTGYDMVDELFKENK